MVFRLKKFLFVVLASAFALSTTLPATAVAQTTGKRISVSFKEKSVAYILDFISRQGEYKVDYTDEVKNDTLTLCYAASERNQTGNNHRYGR